MAGFLLFLLAVAWLLYQAFSKKSCPPGHTFDWEKSSEELKNGLDAKEWNRRIDKGYYWSSKEEVNDKKRTRELNEFCKNRLYECKYIYFTNYQYMWDTYKKQFKNNRDSKGNMLPLDEEARLILSMFEKNCLKDFHIQMEKYQRELEKLKANHSDEAAIERIRKEKWLAYYEQGIKDLYKELGITAKDDHNIREPIDDNQSTTATVSFPETNQEIMSNPHHEHLNVVDIERYMYFNREHLSITGFGEESSYIMLHCKPKLEEFGFSYFSFEGQPNDWILYALKDNRKYIFRFKMPIYRGHNTIASSLFTYCIEAVCKTDLNNMGTSFVLNLLNQKPYYKIDTSLQYARKWCNPDFSERQSNSFKAHFLTGEIEYFYQKYKINYCIEMLENEEFVPLELTGVHPIFEEVESHTETTATIEISSSVQSPNNKFDAMDGHEFENFCADVLRNNGYVDVNVTIGSGDQGIDIIAYKDDIKYGIQCKCYASDVGNKAVQEVFSGKAFYNCHVGVVLTNSYFTHSAIELARSNGIVLWNRDKLLQMIESVKWTEGEIT